jgi:glycosyltransferase involved in cell wall biosynthesis
MNILHVISSVNPAGGGPIAGVLERVPALARRGVRLEIACSDSPDAAHLKEFPVPVHPLGPGRLTYSYNPRLVSWLKENASKYDAVVVNGIWQYHSLAVWRALRKTPTPYFVFTHGMLDPWFKQTYPLKHLKKSLYWRWGEYRVLRDANAVLFTCDEERVLARKSFSHYRCNEVVVNYGTAGPTREPEELKRAFFARFPGLRGRRLALFVGRIHPKKGVDLLIAAFARALARDPDWHLVLAGPDQINWQRKLASIADRLGVSDRITWTGMITGDVKWGAYLASEVFVLPSHQENFGIVVAEALACGLPALISNKVNIWREVQDEGAGIVANDDLEGTCSLLNTWLAMSIEEKPFMREYARQCFQRRFEIQKSADSFIRVLSSVAQYREGGEYKPSQVPAN